MSQILEHLVVSETSVFAEGLESRSILRVCRKTVNFQVVFFYKWSERLN